VLSVVITIVSLIGLGTIIRAAMYVSSLGRLRSFVRPARGLPVQVVINTAPKLRESQTTRRDKQVLFGNLEAAFHVIRAWGSFRDRSSVIPSLSDDRGIDYGSGHLVVLGGTISGEIGDALLERVSKRHGLPISFDEEDEADNRLAVGEAEFHLNWEEQVRQGLHEDYALIVVSANPFSDNRKARAFFIGGFTSLATLAAARWVFRELPRVKPSGHRPGLRPREEVVVLRIEAIEHELSGCEVLLHTKLKRLIRNQLMGDDPSMENIAGLMKP